MKLPVMQGWKEAVKLLEKQTKCPHPIIVLGADGKTGICLQCGKTVRFTN